MNKIKIIEKNNMLEFDGDYLPIIGGNSNYELEFSFDELWSDCLKKTIIFKINGRRLVKSFEGNTVEVPVLPNAPYVEISLSTGDVGEIYSTTSIRIDMLPSPSIEEIPDLEPAKLYLQEIEGAVNGLKNGSIVVDQAKLANSAEMATVASFASNVSGQNLLINSNFEINQRGSATYSSQGYTVDRWIALSTSTFVITPIENGGITISNTGSSHVNLCQYIEHYKKLQGKKLSLSVMVGENLYTKTFTAPSSFSSSSTMGLVETAFGSVYCSYDNGKFAFIIKVDSNKSATISYAKLEFGEKPTVYVPEFYDIELMRCQRYFFKSRVYAPMYAYSPTVMFGMITSPVRLYKKPTLYYANAYYFRGEGKFAELDSSAVAINSINDTACNIVITATSSGMTQNKLYWIESSTGAVQFDAEIY